MSKLLILLIMSWCCSVFAENNKLEILRYQAKKVLQTNMCVNCHTPYLSTTREGALRVFNLGNSTWFESMSEKQLKKVANILSDHLSKEELNVFEKELGTKLKSVSKKDAKIFSQFVDAELSYRKEKNH